MYKPQFTTKGATQMANIKPHNTCGLRSLTGVIVYRKAFWITSVDSLLVLDSQAWIGDMAERFRKREAEAVANKKDIEAFSLGSLAEELECWVNGDDSALSVMHPIFLRQFLSPRTVVADFGHYVEKLVALSLPSKAIEPEFVLVADGRKPPFSALSRTAISRCFQGLLAKE